MRTLVTQPPPASAGPLRSAVVSELLSVAHARLRPTSRAGAMLTGRYATLDQLTVNKARFTVTSTLTTRPKTR